MSVRRLRKKVGKEVGIAFQAATKNIGGLGKLPFAGVLLTVLQSSLEITAELIANEIHQATCRDHRGQCERPGNAPGQSARLSPSPLPPPLGQAAIGDTAKRQIIQVSPQVVRQGSCIAITLGGLRGQAFQNDVGQPDADLGIAAVAELVGCIPDPAPEPPSASRSKSPSA